MGSRRRSEARQAQREAEERQRRAAARSRRLQIVGAGVVITVVVVVMVGSFTGVLSIDLDNSSGAQGAEPRARHALPPPVIADADRAAAAAGCRIVKTPEEGNVHESRRFGIDEFDQNPPTSGSHHPTPAPDGVYPADETPPLGELVHAHEHGRIAIQYRQGTDAALVARLESLLAETEGYHMLLHENRTKMPARVAATAWDAQLTCEGTGPQLWDALRTFRDTYVDTAPEKVP